MRRDICCYYERPLNVVFNAYMLAIKNVFEKDASPEPHHTITFGLNFSFKYNMNGGACTVHFMPYQNGTAVDVRYSIAQALGARYGAHCEAMTKYVEGLLKARSAPINIDVEEFLKPQNQITCAQPSPVAQPVPQSAPQPAPQYVPKPAPQPSPVRPVQSAPVQPAQFKFCPDCGTKLNMADRFCTKCGKQQKA